MLQTPFFKGWIIFQVANFPPWCGCAYSWKILTFIVITANSSSKQGNNLLFVNYTIKCMKNPLFSFQEATIITYILCVSQYEAPIMPDEGQTHSAASDWHHPTAPHKTWNSVLWALWEWSPPSLHIMLWHFPTATRQLLNRQRQLRNVSEAELEDVKPTPVELSRAIIVLCQPKPLPRDRAFEKSLQVKHLVYEPLCLTSLSCKKYDPEHSSPLSLALDPSAWGP